jgi:hypothetical protein
MEVDIAVKEINKYYEAKFYPGEMDMDDKQKAVDFSIVFASKVSAKRKDYRERLVCCIKDFWEGCSDDWRDWDSYITDEIEEYFSSYGGSMTKKLKSDMSCAIRVAIDLFVCQSGGVVGYTVGDLKKAFDGIIPRFVCTMYKEDLNKVNENNNIWL